MLQIGNKTIPAFTGIAPSIAESVNSRRIINGVDDGMFAISPLKHQWAKDMYDIMLKSTWTPAEVQMADDIRDWPTLTAKEQRVYKRTLAFLSNLDGIASNNLACNMVRSITSPEVAATMIRQSFEEINHVYSYTTMIEALAFDPTEIYQMYQVDRDLYYKNKGVLQSFAFVAHKDFTTEGFENTQIFLEACIGNVILEGLYFYSGFLTFFNFARNQKMLRSSDMIAFIAKDEFNHLQFFLKIVKTIIEENPQVWTPEFQQKMSQKIQDAVSLEIEWGLSSIDGGILGLTDATIVDYIQFTGDCRLTEIGLPKVYNVKNPCGWVDEYNGATQAEANFFEGTVKDYSVGGLSWD